MALRGGKVEPLVRLDEIAVEPVSAGRPENPQFESRVLLCFGPLADASPDGFVGSCVRRFGFGRFDRSQFHWTPLVVFPFRTGRCPQTSFNPLMVNKRLKASRVCRGAGAGRCGWLRHRGNMFGLH